MENRQQNVRVITAESDSKFVFDSCCFCIPLRTGCLILGYIQLVALILEALFSVLGIGAGVAVSHSEQLKQMYTQEQLDLMGTIIIAVSAVALVLVLISLPFTIILLVGLHKERRNYVKIYLVFAVIMTVVNLLHIIGTGYGGYSTKSNIGSTVVGILLTIYYLLVLRSHYIKMGQSANNLPPQYYREGQLMQKA